MFKTGLAVVLAFYLSEILNLQAGFLAAIAAVLAIKPSILGSFKHMRNQTIANIIGATVAFIALYFIGDSPLIIGVVITLVILLSVHFKMNTGVEIAIVTVIAIMGFNMGNSDTVEMKFALNRFLGVFVGILSATAVNILFFPPKYGKKFKKSIINSHTKTAFLMKNVLTYNLEKNVFNKEKSAIKKELKTTKNLFDLYYDEIKAKFFKSKYKDKKDLVILKNIVSCLQHEELTLKAIDRYYLQISTSENEFRDKLHEQILSLVDFQEQIIFKYEKKIRTTFSYEEAELVENNNRRLLEETVKNVKNDDFSIYLFPVISSIIEWLEQLEKTEKLIMRFHKEEEKDKSDNISEEILQKNKKKSKRS